jgi:hypothetical protein
VKLALCGLCWLLLGCGSDASEQPAVLGRPRGVVPSRIARQPEPTASPEQPASPQPATEPWPEQEPEAPAKPEKPVEPEKRDYGAELLAALGSPTDCLKPRQGPDSPPEIKVELEAYLLETGTMSRGYARSSELDPDELKCIRSKLESRSLKGPIEQAPRAVHASLSFKVKTPEKSVD